MAKLLNDEPGEMFLKGTLYGKSGAGKTTLGVTAPKPLILLTERQGFRSVKDAVTRLGCEMPPTIWIQSLEDVRVALSVLQSNHDRPIEVMLRRLLGDDAEEQIASLAYAKPESVVLDSVTEMFALVSDDIEHVAGRKIGRDGLETKPERYWGVLRERSERLIRKFRDLPYHVFFLALLKDSTIGEGDQATRVVEPACPMRALPSALAASVNVVGLVSVKQEPRKVESEDGESKIVYDYKRTVRFAGPGWMMVKPMGDLGSSEEADISSWIDRVLTLSGGEQAAEADGLADADEHGDGLDVESEEEPDDSGDGRENKRAERRGKTARA